MDVVLETLLKKKRGKSDFILLACMIVLGIAVSALLFVLLFFVTLALGELGQIAGGIGMLLIAGVWYAIYKIYNSRSIEYEYSVVNNEIDIDKVMAKKSRKHMVTVDIRNAEIMACVDDEENNGVYKNLDKSVKVLDLSAGNENMYTYFIDCTVDDKRCVVLFQPTSKMVEGLWRFNPKAVKKYNLD